MLFSLKTRLKLIAVFVVLSWVYQLFEAAGSTEYGPIGAYTLGLFLLLAGGAGYYFWRARPATAPLSSPGGASRPRRRRKGSRSVPD